jgi:hypothetical protein
MAKLIRNHKILLFKQQKMSVALKSDSFNSSVVLPKELPDSW